MPTVIEAINQSQRKSQVTDVRSGDIVKVHQRVREGKKERIQVFQGLVIKTAKQGGHMSRITVRRMASGVGVEKGFLLHSPMIVKVEVTKRSKVRRNYITYMRARTGKAARLESVEFDRDFVNAAEEAQTSTTTQAGENIPAENKEAEAAEPVNETKNNEESKPENKVQS